MNGNRVGSVILAAGGSSRMGFPKQLLCFHGKPLIRWAVDNACAVTGSASIVVLGANAGAIRSEMSETPAHIISNGEWTLGIGASIKAGLTALLSIAPHISGAMFLLGDQPLITSLYLSDLMARHFASPDRIIASSYNNTQGVPVIFPRTCFLEILDLPDSEGAQAILKRHRDQLIVLDCPSGAMDIDTAADYENLNRLSGVPTKSAAASM